jgi:ParB family chromosome partitioning protein
LICLEQAIAFANLSQQFHLTQEEIGKRVGLSRGVVSNYMRLLGLPSGVQEALWGGKMSYSHARLLSRLTDDIQIWSLAKRVMEEKMSVDQLEAVMIGVPKPGKDPNKSAARWVDPNVKAAQRSLEEILGMRVRIRDRQGRGRILIDYGTIEDFDRVVGMLGGK